MIADEEIAGCTGTADFIPILRREFKNGNYQGVIEGIDRFVAHATANRAPARARLRHMLKPFVHNYVVAATIEQHGSIIDWAEHFQRLLTDAGAPVEDSWEDFVDEASGRGPAAFAEAIAIIRSTCEQFVAECEAGDDGT